MCCMLSLLSRVDVITEQFPFVHKSTRAGMGSRPGFEPSVTDII